MLNQTYRQFFTTNEWKLRGLYFELRMFFKHEFRRRAVVRQVAEVTGRSALVSAARVTEGEGQQGAISNPPLLHTADRGPLSHVPRFFFFVSRCCRLPKLSFIARTSPRLKQAPVSGLFYWWNPCGSWRPRSSSLVANTVTTLARCAATCDGNRCPSPRS